VVSLTLLFLEALAALGACVRSSPSYSLKHQRRSSLGQRLSSFSSTYGFEDTAVYGGRPDLSSGRGFANSISKHVITQNKKPF
jgi:hypothetical protein